MPGSKEIMNISVYALYEHEYFSLWESLAKIVDLKFIYVFNKGVHSDTSRFSKMRWIIDIARAFKYRNLLRVSNEKPKAILVIGHIILPFLFWNYFKLRGRNHYSVYAFASFFHNALLMRLYGLLLRWLMPDEIVFLAFSRADIPLFLKYFRVPYSQINYLPYGSGPIEGMQPSIGDYCFAGGYSNRNYDIVIDAFSKIDEKLIICCAKNNKLPPIIPSNITVYKDLPLHEFTKLLSGAKLCIMSLNPKAGACGQSVTLKYMQFGKPIVATNTLAITDYLNDSNACIIEPNNSHVLANAAVNLIGDEAKRKALGEQAKKDYYENYQAKHFEARLFDLIIYE